MQTWKKKRVCKICKKTFIAKYETPLIKPVVCGNICCLKYYNKLVATGKIKGRRGAAKIAHMVGKRSMAEVKFEIKLKQACRGTGQKIRYESQTFEYFVHSKHTYLPDWVIRKKDRPDIYIEYKGKFTIQDRKKMLNVRKYWPKLDLRLVFTKPQNKLSSKSKTTYAQWADKHNFIWGDIEAALKWVKEK